MKMRCKRYAPLLNEHWSTQEFIQLNGNNCVSNSAVSTYQEAKMIEESELKYHEDIVGIAYICSHNIGDNNVIQKRLQELYDKTGKEIYKHSYNCVLAGMDPIYDYWYSKYLIGQKPLNRVISIITWPVRAFLNALKGIWLFMIDDGGMLLFAIPAFILGIVVLVIYYTEIQPNERGEAANTTNKVASTGIEWSAPIAEYDNKVITGNEVRAALKIFSRQKYAVIIKSSIEDKYYNYNYLLEGVKTSNGEPPILTEIPDDGSIELTDTYYDKATNVKDSTSPEYIPLTRKYKSKLFKDKNGVIIAILMTPADSSK